MEEGTCEIVWAHSTNNPPAVSFAPPGIRIPRTVPGLAPWAVIWRRFAAAVGHLLRDLRLRIEFGSWPCVSND